MNKEKNFLKSIEHSLTTLIPIDRDVFYLYRRNKAAVLSLFIVGAFVFSAVFADFLAPYDPLELNLGERLSPPSYEHLLGQDQVGRDILSRILHGAKISLWIGVTTVLISMSVGTAFGLLAGYWGGKTDTVIMRIVDILLSFPAILLAIVIMAALGPSLFNALLAVALVYMPRYTRIVRGSTLSIKQNQYIEAARMVGAGHLRIMIRHILPNLIAPILVYATLQIGMAILEVAGIGFLGLGAQPPTPEWGAILNDGRGYMIKAPHIAFFPGLAIFITVMAFNMMGDGLRDALDPRLRN